MHNITRTSPLISIFTKAKQSANKDASIMIRPAWPITAIEISVWQDQFTTFQAYMAQLDLNIDLDQPYKAAKTKIAALLPIGPLKWLLVANGELGILDDLKKVIPGDVASLVDQSHGLSGIHISGEAASLLLRKGCAADIDTYLQPGMAGRFGWGHYSLTIYCEQINRYQLFVMRSLAEAFAEQLFDAALPQGYLVE